MIGADDVRTLALGLPGASERPAPRGGHLQFLTNGKCFAELPATDPPQLNTWHEGGWRNSELADTNGDEAARRLQSAWRQRAKKLDVARLDYARGREDLSDVFAELRTWPELTERGEGDFGAAGRAFLHFHHFEDRRYADVKEGLGWGEAIAFPLGRPSPDVIDGFLIEVRRRLSITTDAVEARKAHSKMR